MGREGAYAGRWVDFDELVIVRQRDVGGFAGFHADA